MYEYTSLYKKHIKITTFAKNNKVSRQLVYEAIKGQGTRRIRIEIALIMQRKPSEIWLKNNEKRLWMTIFIRSLPKTATFTAIFKTKID
ncbi:MAG: hypothetical protein Q9M50_02120 [Methylococcales bacterium]|nr:hypothetical protein [Methylococcales bacterium]